MSTGDFLVKSERFTRAQTVFLEKARTLDPITLIQISVELELDKFGSFDQSGKLQFDLTPLQWVAFAAAVVAAVESECAREGGDLDIGTGKEPEPDNNYEDIL